MSKARIKHKRISTGGKKIAGLPFMGEIMECAICHAKQKSDPKIESGWTAITMDTITKYMCPACFGK